MSVFYPSATAWIEWEHRQKNSSFWDFSNYLYYLEIFIFCSSGCHYLLIVSVVRIWFGKGLPPSLNILTIPRVLTMQDYLEDLLEEVIEEFDDEFTEDYSELWVFLSYLLIVHIWFHLLSFSAIGLTSKMFLLLSLNANRITQHIDCLAIFSRVGRKSA